MTFNELASNPQSKKIAVIEIDVPIQGNTWVNDVENIYSTDLVTGKYDLQDGFGNIGFWGLKEDQSFSIKSINIDGSLYAEVTSFSLLVEQTWYLEDDILSIFFKDNHPPEMFNVIYPGKVLGFTNQIDTTTNNYFDDIYYNPILTNVPAMNKSKDQLFYGLMKYEGGNISFTNNDGFFDGFESLDVFNQPVRLYMTFEGLPTTEWKKIFTGKVEDFSYDFTTFSLVIADGRKSLNQTIPVRELSLVDFPDMDETLEGNGIPVPYGSVIKGITYRTGPGQYTFADVTYNPIDSGVVVYSKENDLITHTGTGVDGTFQIDFDYYWNSTYSYVVGDRVYSDGIGIYECIQAGDNHAVTQPDWWDVVVRDNDKLFVSYSQTTVVHGLDVIKDIMKNYQDIAFTANNYNIVEWESEESNVSNVGVLLSDDSNLTTLDIIEKICTENQMIFEVEADGRYTVRILKTNVEPVYTIEIDEILDDPVILYDTDELVSSVTVKYSKDELNNTWSTYTNSDYKDSVYARYRQTEKKTYETLLTSLADAEVFSERVMDQSKTILPTITLTFKTQLLDIKILDLVYYECKRNNGSVVIPLSHYQVIGITYDFTNFEVTLDIKQVALGTVDVVPNPVTALTIEQL